MTSDDSTRSAPDVVVLDYGFGNVRSAVRALQRAGAQVELTADRSRASECDGLVVPGVGAFASCVAGIRAVRGHEVIGRRLAGGRPVLGICVGLQVLFEHSAEGDADCLGWLPGEVVEFRRGELRVPHMGWNAVRRSSAHPFAQALPPAANFYFVNSYHAVPADEADVAGVTEYGPEFASVVARGNVMATQFHIEKSGPVGLALLARFAGLEATQLRAAAQEVPAC